MVTTAGITRLTSSSRLNTGPGGATASPPASDVGITPSSASERVRSLSEKLRDGPFAADDDSLAFLAASASVCASARHANATIRMGTKTSERGSRGHILSSISAVRPRREYPPLHAVSQDAKSSNDISIGHGSVLDTRPAS